MAKPGSRENYYAVRVYVSVHDHMIDDNDDDDDMMTSVIIDDDD